MLFAQFETPPTWFTTLWLFSVGAGIGLILLSIVFALMYLLAKIPGLNTINENKQRRYVVTAIVGVINLAWVLPTVIYFSNSLGTDNISESDANVHFLLGILLAVVGCFLVPLGAMALVSKKTVTELPDTLREGLLKWTTIIFGSMTLFAVSGFLLAMVDGFGVFLPVQEPVRIMSSVTRLWPVTGEKQYTFKVDPNQDEGEPIDVSFIGEELQYISVKSDQRLEITSQPYGVDLADAAIINIPETDPEGEPTYWYNTTTSGDAVGSEPVEQLYVRNMGGEAATIQLTTLTLPEFVETEVVRFTAISIVCFYLLYIAIQAVFPKVGAIALSTYKTEIAQPLFLLIIIVGCVFTVVSVYIPYNTFGEDIKMLKDSGLMTILVFSIFFAVWAASKSVSEEIEGRTALTVLSKPVSRREFIVGKVLGISWSIVLLYLVLGIWFLIWVSYKPIFDGNETAKEDVTWQLCFMETIMIVPGLLLALMEAIIFVAISVAISTRLPILANFMICFAIYVLGHLTPLMVQSTAAIEAFEPVVFFGKFIATVLPVLDHFNVQAAVAGNAQVPPVYLGLSLTYTLIYGSICVLLALVMFEDRDLA